MSLATNILLLLCTYFIYFYNIQMFIDLLNQIDKNNIPKHVAIIMDGNGRWAKAQGENRLFGHFHGVSTVKKITEIAAEIGVEYLTLYTFSKENWNRPKEEVDGLMNLLAETIRQQLEGLKKNNVRFDMIGDWNSLPHQARTELEIGKKSLENNTGLHLTLAINYSSRWEIELAVKNIAMKVLEQTLSLDDINEQLVAEHLNTAHMPDPELMIRTGGEHRISNFLLYQLAYAELYFTNVLWPSFSKEDFLTAIINYQQRERRFGKTSEQLYSE